MSTLRWFALVALLLLIQACPSRAQIRVVIWDEQQPQQKEAYENFIGNYLADRLRERPGIQVRSVCLADPEQGLSRETLDQCDVLIWWGHLKHGAIGPDKAKAIVDRLQAGKLSLIVLHSALDSRPFGLAMEERAKADALKGLSEEERKGAALTTIHPPRRPAKAGEKVTPFTEVIRKADRVEIKLTLPTCVIAGWKEEGKPSHVTILAPDHPIARNLPRTFDIPHTEMYKEPWEVPAPDTVIFEERWDGGEQFRGGCVWTIGKGRLFYFRPGHETYAVYKEKNVQTILENAVRWLAGGK